MKLKDIIGPMASKFVALALALVCADSAWAADPVAKIGTTEYTTLADAVAAAQDGETVQLLADAAQNDGIIFDKAGAGVILDLDGKTFTVNTGANCNNRAFRIDNGTLTVKNGSIVAAGSGTTSSNGAGCYGAFRVEKGGTLNIQDATLSNSRPWGLNVKICGGRANLERVTINSSYGGGIEVTEADLGALSQPGYAELTDCTFTQTGYFDHCSTALSVSGGSELVVNSGTYTSENYGLYVFSSGGKITVKGGTITGENKAAVKAAMDTNTYPAYTGAVQISGGRFKGTLDVTSPASMSISGGVFTIAPGTAYLAPGYVVITNTDAATKDAYPYTVAGAVAQIGETKYATLAEAIAAVPTTGAETTITMIANSAEPAVITVASGKSVVLDLNGKTVSYTTDAKSVYFLTNEGTLTIQDNSANADGQVLLTAQPDTGYSKETVTIYNCGGTLTLASGTIKNATAGGLAYAVNNSSNAWGAGDDKVSTFNMTGGKVSAPGGDAALRVYQNCAAHVAPVSKNYVNISGGTIVDTGIFVDTVLYTDSGIQEGFADSIDTQINISGGTVNGLIDLKIRHKNNTKLNITGGNFTNAMMWVRKKADEYKGDEPTEPMVSISGGKFAFVTGKAFGLSYDCGATSWTTYAKPYAVSGGVFNVEVPENACVAGKTSIANTETETKDAYPYTVGVAVAQIGTKGYATLPDAIAAAQNGDTVKLLADIDLGSGYVAIDKALTLDGDFTVTSSAAQAVLLTGSGDVTIKCDVTATAGHGIQAGTESAAYSGKLTVDGSTVTVAKRGIRVYKEDTGFGIVVNGSTIQSNVADPTTTYTTGNDAMALSLGTTDGKDYSVELNNTVLQGFSYCINSVTSGSNLTVVMNGGKTYGRAALNVWGSNNTFTLDGVEVHGLNNQTGPTEAFACIVENKGATNNTYNINGCTFNAELSSAAASASGSSASEQLLLMNGTGSTVNIKGNTTYAATVGGEPATAANADRFGFIFNNDGVEKNTITLDATSLANLKDDIDDVIDTTTNVDGQGNVTLSYVVPAYRFYVANSKLNYAIGEFAELFAGCANMYALQLRTNVEIADTLNWTKTGDDQRVLFINQDAYGLTAANNAKINLAAGDVVLSDKTLDILTAPEGYVVNSYVDDQNQWYKFGDNGSGGISVSVVSYPYVYEVALPVAQIGDAKYVTFADAIAAAEAYYAENGTYPEIAVLDATAEQSNPDWKIADGKLVKKTYVAQIVETSAKFETLAEAIDAADEGCKVVLLADATGSGIVIGKSIEIEGDGHTVSSTVNYPLFLIGTAGKTIKFANLAISHEVPKNSSATYAIYIAGASEVEIDGCEIDSVYYGIGVVTANGAKLAVTNSTISAWSSLYLMRAQNCKVDVSDSTLDGNNRWAATPQSDFATVMIQANGGTSSGNAVTLTDCVINASTTINKQVPFCFVGGSDNSIVVAGDGTIVSWLAEDAIIEDYGTNDSLSISGGMFSAVVPAGYCASGYLCTTVPVANGYYQVVPAATVTFSKGEEANVTDFVCEPMTYPSGNPAEIALPQPTYTAEVKTFAGWKVKDSDPELILSAIPAGATTDYELVATWTVVRSVQVTEGVSEAQNIKVTEAWLDLNNIDKDDDIAIQAALNETDANGLPAWQNYVLGQDPNASVAADAAQGAVNAMPVVSTVTPQTVDTGFKVEYRVDEVNADGTPKAGGEGALQDTPALTVDLTELTPENNVAYYKTVAVITSTDPNKDVTVTVESTNTVGVLMVESGAKTTAIAVPWEALGGGDISVSNIVRTANLTPGDELMAYAPDGKYKAWELDANKVWQPVTVAGGSSETEADAYTVKRGSAVWLKRQDTTQPIYLVGGVAATEKAAATLEAGTAESPSWNLVGSAGTEPVNVNEIGAAATDKIIVPTATVPKNYEHNTEKGEWGYWDYETVIKPSGRKTVKKVWKSASVETIPAGTGFWYLNGGDSKDINL